MKRSCDVAMPMNWHITAISWKAKQMNMDYGELSNEIRLGKVKAEEVYGEFKLDYVRRKNEEMARIAAANQAEVDERLESKEMFNTPLHFTSGSDMEESVLKKPRPTVCGIPTDVAYSGAILQEYVC